MDILMHLTKCSEGSMVASARIARFLSTQLGLPLIHTKSQLDDLMTQARCNRVDKFILVNSPTGFADKEMRESCAELSYISRKPIFVMNDYKMRPPSQCKSYNLDKFMDYKGESSDFYGFSIWGTVPGVARRGVSNTYINWNMLTYSSHIINSPHTKRDRGLIYWGALRKGREERLNRFLDGLDVTVSTSPQTFSKFKKWLPSANYIRQFNNLHTALIGYKATLYTQDEYSDSVYCSLANRFYEALSCGVAIFIDIESSETFKLAGLQGYEEFLVRDSVDIELMLDDSQAIASKQKSLWGRDYISELICDTKKQYINL